MTDSNTDMQRVMIQYDKRCIDARKEEIKRWMRNIQFLRESMGQLSKWTKVGRRDREVYKEMIQADEYCMKSALGFNRIDERRKLQSEIKLKLLERNNEEVIDE